MPRHVISVIVVSLLLALTNVALAAEGDTKVEGKRLYHSYCFLCHGNDGKGTGVLAKKLGIEGAIADLTSEKYTNMGVDDLTALIEGYGRRESIMPKWSKVLERDELRNIANYVKSIGPRYAYLNGKSVYAFNCMTCHGVDGKGGGRLANTLRITDSLPDLTSDKYKTMSEAALLQMVISYSTQQAMLPGWDTVLADEQLRDVVRFIQRFGETEVFIYGDPLRGERVYKLNCVACHGASGKGDGVLAEMLDVEMINYTTRSQLDISDEGLIHVISMGRGEFMPSWLGALSVDEIRDVAAYVRTIYRESE